MRLKVGQSQSVLPKSELIQDIREKMHTSFTENSDTPTKKRK